MGKVASKNIVLSVDFETCPDLCAGEITYVSDVQLTKKRGEAFSYYCEIKSQYLDQGKKYKLIVEEID